MDNCNKIIRYFQYFIKIIDYKLIRIHVLQAEEESAAAAAAAAAATAAASANSSAVAAAAAAVAGPSSLDPLELGRRSVGGVPLRLLGRQNAVDRRSPDSEESPGPPDLAEDRGGGDPPFPWRGGSFYGPGGPEVFRPNLRPSHPDCAQEREVKITTSVGLILLHILGHPEQQ